MFVLLIAHLCCCCCHTVCFQWQSFLSRIIFDIFIVSLCCFLVCLKYFYLSVQFLYQYLHLLFTILHLKNLSTICRVLCWPSNFYSCKSDECLLEACAIVHYLCKLKLSIYCQACLWWGVHLWIVSQLLFSSGKLIWILFQFQFLNNFLTLHFHWSVTLLRISVLSCVIILLLNSFSLETFLLNITYVQQYCTIYIWPIS